MDTASNNYSIHSSESKLVKTEVPFIVVVDVVGGDDEDVLPVGKGHVCSTKQDFSGSRVKLNWKSLSSNKSLCKEHSYWAIMNSSLS